MKKQINFGTDGWRGRIADDFTFENVRLVTQALVDYLKDGNLTGNGIAAGYDNRFQSEHFARAAAEVCSGAGINVFLTEHPVSSPALSYAVKSMGLGAGIMLTASHNPPEWNGFKIKEAFGGSAFPETTKEVEKRLEETLRIVPSAANIKSFDPRPTYLDKIKSLVNLDLLKTHNLKIVIDPMYGSGAGCFTALGVPVVEIRGNRNPLFGGVNPEPLPVNLEESISFVKELALKYANELTACIVLDGDADRLAAIDGSGRFINTHQVFTLLLHHLVVHRKLSGEVVKTFNVSNLADKLCRKYQLNLTVTPIGFKHIAKMMLEKDILLGGEESGGMGIKGFIPERDGILAGLMLLELMACEKKTLAQILDEIMREHGYFFYDRIDLHTEGAMDTVKKITAAPPEKLGGMEVAKVETLDGLKLNFADESWILFRASGTEPLLRIYAEGRTEEEVKTLLAAGENLIRQQP
ncbi:phosphoglucomutase/phosphomannomutase family protein [Candidatus Saganbacteria bacterium]|uniref:Phosphoglucomutase/phosphomannomutase family protein n=1 Tax=Candidatus Saganbacteria bacterium TaxID=2575572 RepID=A0A9D6YSY0_UNCSA|nr:phosphoglucomutase/phosphomannomutase family protein [Candidatus Saganbacteria bacterium]